MGIFSKGVKKTNENFFQRISRAVVGKSRVSEDVLDAIEEALVSSDMGVETTLKIIDNLEDRVEKDKYMSQDELVAILRDEIGKLLNVGESGPVQPFDFSKKPYVIMVVGVNGVGKTTTISKLAASLTAQGKRLLLALPILSGPLPLTSWSSGRSAPGQTLSSSRWARIPHPWLTIPSALPLPKAPMSS